MKRGLFLLILSLLWLVVPAMAQDKPADTAASAPVAVAPAAEAASPAPAAAVPVPNKGDTAWMITATALGGLFSHSIAMHYALGLVLLAVAAIAFTARRSFDVFCLSAVALGLNTLLVAGLARLLFDNSRRDPIGPLLLIGLVAAGLLAASVSALLKLARHRGAQEDQA